jgi:hypothetical protein
VAAAIAIVASVKTAPIEPTLATTATMMDSRQMSLLVAEVARGQSRGLAEWHIIAVLAVVAQVG